MLSSIVLGTEQGLQTSGVVHCVFLFQSDGDV